MHRLTRPVGIVLAMLAGMPAVSTASWIVDGVPIVTAAGNQYGFVVAADGTGGVLVAWRDSRSGDAASDIYAQRLLSDGSRAAGWPADGAAVCLATGVQVDLAICSDGAGGAFIAWEDARESTHRVYVQRLSASGAVAAGWPVDGLLVPGVGAWEELPAVVSDAAGGVYLAWDDARNGTGNVLVQRLASDGSVVPGWPGDGLQVGNPASNRSRVSLAADGSGGVIAAAIEFGSGSPTDLVVQRLTPEGAVLTGWPADGLLIPVVLPGRPAALPDGSGGAVVAWLDGRNGPGPDCCPRFDVFGDRVADTGSIVPGWPASGLYLGQSPAIAGDGAGGIATAAAEPYGDHGLSRIKVRRLDGSAMTPSGWPADGVEPCPQFNAQFQPALASDGEGGLFVCWGDSRFGAQDLYAARLTSTGALASGWFDTGSQVSTAPGGQSDPHIVTDAAADPIVVWADTRKGDLDIYASNLAPNVPGPPVPQSTDAVEPGPNHGLSLLALWPNPSQDRVAVAFTLPSALPARLEVFDLAGRLLVRQDVGASRAGNHTAVLDVNRALPVGLYRVRLEQAGTRIEGSLVHVR